MYSMGMHAAGAPVVDAGGQYLGAGAGAEEGAVDHLGVVHAGQLRWVVVCRCRHKHVN